MSENSDQNDNCCCFYFEPPIVVIFAVEEEVDIRFFNNKCCQTIITGVGKVNASIFSLLKLLNRKTVPKLILNLGTCGSFKFPQGTLTQCFTLYQYDMNATEAGLPLGLTPFETYININVFDKKLDITNNPKLDVKEAILFCGDVFVTKNSYVYTQPVIVNGLNASNADEPIVFAFEGYELGKISKELNVPYATIKIISDSGSFEDFKKFLETARPKLYEVFELYKKIVL